MLGLPDMETIVALIVIGLAFTLLAYLFVRLLETLRSVTRTLSEVNEKWCLQNYRQVAELVEMVKADPENPDKVVRIMPVPTEPRVPVVLGRE